MDTFIKKINLSDESEVRERIYGGIKAMNDLVSMTLGANGKSIMIERGVGEPLIVDDGRRVAENIKLDDPIAQLAVRTAYAVTRKTDEKVGDGTTTAMVLTHAILAHIHKNHVATGGFGVKANVAELDRQIKEACEEICKKLDAMATPIKTEKDLISVAPVVSGDAKLGEIIGKMYWKLGKDGHITLEFNLLSEQIETEVVSGYRFLGGYASDWMITDALRRNCILADVDVLVAQQKILDIKDIEPIANIVANSGKNRMVIIGQKFSPSVLKHIYVNATRKKSPFFILCVRSPGRTMEAYKDMALFTGGKFFSADDDLKLATKADLGYVEKIELTDDTCILIEGKGKKADLEKRIKEVEAEANAQKLPQFKQDRLERMSALSGGVGLIKIGAPTDEERNWLKYKIEDAKHATKIAFKEGYVPGGGQAFRTISKALSEDNILREAILAPYEKLKENSGDPENFKVGKEIIDPVLVEKTALTNACSAVSKLLRIGGAIALAPKPTLDEAFKGFAGKVGDDGLIEEDTDVE